MDEREKVWKKLQRKNVQKFDIKNKRVWGLKLSLIGANNALKRNKNLKGNTLEVWKILDKNEMNKRKCTQHFY